MPKYEDGRCILDDVPILDTWRALEKLVDLGLVRTIGFSNFNSKQITEVIKNCRVKPAILQVESNPRFQNTSLRYSLLITLGPFEKIVFKINVYFSTLQ